MILGLLKIWFDNPNRLATALVFVTARVAFALQKVIAAIAGYFLILRSNIFSVGDRITIGAVRGDVIALGFIHIFGKKSAFPFLTAPMRSCRANFVRLYRPSHGKYQSDESGIIALDARSLFSPCRRFDTFERLNKILFEFERHQPDIGCFPNIENYICLLFRNNILTVGRFKIWAYSLVLTLFSQEKYDFDTYKNTHIKV